MRNEAVLSRREFLLRASGTGGAAMLGLAGFSTEQFLAIHDSRIMNHEFPEQLSRIGVQLYTVRNAMRASVEKTLEQVAKIGYKEVEFAGYFNRTPKEIRAILDANGLTAPSAHSAAMPAIRTRFAQVLDEAATIGHKYVLCASIPRSEMTIDGFKRVAGELSRAGEQAAKLGIKVGFHNHSDDLAPLGDTTGFDILLTECDPKVTSMQMDLFWQVKGGKDPLVYFAKYPGRFYSVHVKDMNASGAMVDVGGGQLPFAKYFAQSKQAGIQHYFVEHDEPAAPMASIEVAYKHLSALQF
jgi:sugar phosphate isomerase/epimerase